MARASITSYKESKKMGNKQIRMKVEFEIDTYIDLSEEDIFQAIRIKLESMMIDLRLELSSSTGESIGEATADYHILDETFKG